MGLAPIAHSRPRAIVRTFIAAMIVGTPLNRPTTLIEVKLANLSMEISEDICGHAATHNDDPCARVARELEA
jgi:hypothetical protein